tara:strand:+ start:463 stop:831 length:369 start_codon:yes stop_codon:yes gene_type:complete
MEVPTNTFWIYCLLGIALFFAVKTIIRLNRILKEVHTKFEILAKDLLNTTNLNLELFKVLEATGITIDTLKKNQIIVNQTILEDKQDSLEFQELLSKVLDDLEPKANRLRINNNRGIYSRKK